MCKHRCIEDWKNNKDECKMIQYNTKSKQCKTTNKNFKIKRGGGGNSQVSEKIKRSPLRPR